jgi:hypothetical protein
MSKLSRVRAFASVALVAVAIVLAASAPSQAQRGGSGHGGEGHEGGPPSRGEGHHDFGERRDFYRGRDDASSFGDPYYEGDPPAGGSAAPEYRYYCPSYGDYYPNVGSCPDPWVPEPAS